MEEQTYKIHRYFLTRESEFFKDLFSLPPPPAEEPESVEGSDNNPIKVSGTPTNEFENLLRFFYFGYGCVIACVIETVLTTDGEL